ncbi:unnamed protein product [Ostreobium quekettii]|uniref:RRM domain-containing protein n=1 Tax=Ostreobium quekettii TaxID=121088 RepID=A0A8S1J0K6_9CHLO|nr:unnamed protein product [Ostreobium quekettii]
MDENYLNSLFAHTQDVSSVRLIRNKTTAASEGYGFIDFRTREAAERVLCSYNGRQIPNTDHVFKMNWASIAGSKAPPPQDYSLFVGDVAPEVNDYVLMEHFRQYYPSVRSAKVMTDSVTNRSKGYGFVRFTNEAERDRALHDMNGSFLANRSIRVSLATARRLGGGGGTSGRQSSQVHPSELDPTNTTLFIGGLGATVTEDQLRSIFGRYGEIIYTRVPQGKGCGFVQYVERRAAECAMRELNNQVIGNSAVRISWGRSTARSGAQVGSTANAQSSMSYSYPTGYTSGYGYDATAGHAGYVSNDAYSSYGGYAGAYTGQSAVGYNMSGASGASGQNGSSSVVQPAIYDPRAPDDLDKLNEEFILRNQPPLVSCMLRMQDC